MGATLHSVLELYSPNTCCVSGQGLRDSQKGGAFLLVYQSALLVSSNRNATPTGLSKMGHFMIT